MDETFPTSTLVVLQDKDIQPPKNHKPAVLTPLNVEKNSSLPPYHPSQLYAQSLHFTALPGIHWRLPDPNGAVFFQLEGTGTKYLPYWAWPSTILRNFPSYKRLGTDCSSPKSNHLLQEWMAQRQPEQRTFHSPSHSISRVKV